MPKFHPLVSSLGLPVAAAAMIMLASCLVQGNWSERWETFPELELFADQLAQIPDQVGEWHGTDEEGSDEKIRRIAGAEGELVRTYTNASGQSVRMSIICARLVDIFHHTPDRCYPAAGFDMQGEPQKEVFEVGDGKAEFFTTTFLKSEPSGTHRERGYWSWTADGEWIAPRNPRLEFAGERALYKLYVFAVIPSGNKKTEANDFSADFIRAFMPALKLALEPAMEKAGRLPQKNATDAEPAA
jgi:hypothetical protein